MKKILLMSVVVFAASALFTSCKKSIETKNLWKAKVAVAAPVSDAACLSGAIKGTMLAGKTYTVCGDIIINEGDTLTVQEGVTIKLEGNYGIGVKGSFICLGTKDRPNSITYDGAVKHDVYGYDPSLDSAYKGKWVGIIGGINCPMMIIKWTHIEWAGHSSPSSSPVHEIYAKPYDVLFQNPYGIFVLEDSWVYGSTDDPIRTLGGKIAIMRNTFEKCGYTGGEVNMKAGTIGDVAYNLFVGMNTNGPKLSNSGAIVGVPSSNIRMYNNTLVNCGFRRLAEGRGGSINFEEGAGGMAYNNLIVNCKYGLRVVSNPIADTANLRYGYNWYYADSQSVANNFYPSIAVSNAISNALATDYPNPWTYLPSGWKAGDIYTAPASLLGANDPQFIKGPVPMPPGLLLRDISFAGDYNFALKPTSPCIGKGFTGFSARADVPVDEVYGATEITPPGKDIGAFQSNGTGNQH